MDDRFQREKMLIGTGAFKKLSSSHVMVFGVGGVGAYVCEALARAGVGRLTIVDSDTVSITNINRQLIALTSTVGMKKTDVMSARIKDISPDCTVIAKDFFYSEETKDAIDLHDADYVVDAIDSVSSKLTLIEECIKAKVRIISCMGTGNKTDPSAFVITDIYKTSGCPLARVMRRELKKRGVEKLTVVYSTEPPRKPIQLSPDERVTVPATISFVPPVAAMMLAGKVVNDLTEEK